MSDCVSACVSVCLSVLICLSVFVSLSVSVFVSGSLSVCVSVCLCLRLSMVMSLFAGASIPWGNEAEIFIIAILGENIFCHFRGECLSQRGMDACDGAPNLRNCFYIKYGVLNLRRQFFTLLT